MLTYRTCIVFEFELGLEYGLQSIFTGLLLKLENQLLQKIIIIIFINMIIIIIIMIIIITIMIIMLV